MMEGKKRGRPRMADQQEQWKKFQERLDAIQEEQRKQEERQKSQRAFNVKIPAKRQNMKFTCDELIKLFGGWFILGYAFSTFSDKEFDRNGKPIETIYYVCSQDVSEMRINERPAVNEAISRLIGKKVYGYAIIAPASAFGGERI